MHPPSAATLTTMALVPLLAWRVVMRFRRAAGRQRLSRYRGPIVLTIYGCLMVSIALYNVHEPVRLLGFALALAAGAGLARFALSRTGFEATPTGLYYTPHGPIGIALALLFVARLAWRLADVYVLHPQAQHSFGEFAHSPLTLGVFGLMAGYYAGYMVGLVRWRWRVLQAKARREAGG